MRDDPANYFISALAFCPRLNGGVNGAVDIPPTVRAVWQNAFYANEKITEITFSKGLEAVSYGDVVIPATLTFASGTFQSCEKLEKVSLPEGLTDIDSGTFAWCNTLKEVYIPASIAYIAPRAFDSCGQLSVVNFAETPEGEEGVPLVIGSSSSTNYTGVFSDCGSITSLKLPEHTVELGNYVFEGCTGLTTLHLPASLTKIGDVCVFRRASGNAHLCGRQPTERDRKQRVLRLSAYGDRPARRVGDDRELRVPIQ